MTNAPRASSPSVEIDRQKLRELRQERGLTQVQLASQANLSTQYISQLECGFRTHVSPPTYIALCDALKIPQSRRRMLRKAVA